jgi:hypothetical protein
MNHDAPRHDGKPQANDDDFFAIPPEAIGQILSKQTTLKKGVQPRPRPARIALATSFILASAVGFLVEFFLVQELVFHIIAGIFAGIGVFFGVVLFFDRNFDHVCTYVGREGIVAFRMTGTRDHKIAELVLFKTVVDLYRHVVVGNGTSFCFAWTGADQKDLSAISGAFKHELFTGADPLNEQLYFYALAAEAAWTEYLLATEPKRYANGCLTFRWGTDGDKALVDQRGLRILYKKSTVPIPKENIQKLAVENAVLYIELERQTITQPLAQIGNAGYFLYQLNKLSPVREEASLFRIGTFRLGSQ